MRLAFFIAMVSSTAANAQPWQGSVEVAQTCAGMIEFVTELGVFPSAVGNPAETKFDQWVELQQKYQSVSTVAEIILGPAARNILWDNGNNFGELQQRAFACIGEQGCDTNAVGSLSEDLRRALVMSCQIDFRGD